PAQVRHQSSGDDLRDTRNRQPRAYGRQRAGRLGPHARRGDARPDRSRLWRMTPVCCSATGQHDRRHRGKGRLVLLPWEGTMPGIIRTIMVLGAITLAITAPARAQGNVTELEQEIRQRAAAIESKLIAWRRDIHEHPELGEQEIRTSALVAAHLTNLGLEVKTGVGNTGVVGLLKGAKPGPVVALRADMDALPVKEPPGLPFASKVTMKYLGRDVAVMHACGHDAHTAILMATAEVLTAMKDKLPGTGNFISRRAEEGPSLYPATSDKSWGAKLMVQQGVLQDPKPDAVFGLHVSSGLPAGQLAYRGGPAMASADELRIKVTRRQGPPGYPLRAIYPVTTASHIVLGPQTILNRPPA